MTLMKFYGPCEGLFLFCFSCIFLLALLAPSPPPFALLQSWCPNNGKLSEINLCSGEGGRNRGRSSAQLSWAQERNAWVFGVFLGLKFSFSRSLVCFFFFSRILALSLRIVSPSKRASPNICTATGLFICKQVGIFKKFTSFFMFVSFSWLRICQGWQVRKKKEKETRTAGRFRLVSLPS